jgi:hypothetical protein
LRLAPGVAAETAELQAYIVLAAAVSRRAEAPEAVAAFLLASPAAIATFQAAWKPRIRGIRNRANVIGGRRCAMFFLFSNRLGLVGSILISVIVTIVLVKACTM